MTKETAGIGSKFGTPLRLGLLAAGLVLALLGLAAPAQAVLAGENGRIVFVSGRDGGDATSDLYLRGVVSNSTGGGALSGPIVPAGGQYRHPTWSPDRTRIAFANGTPGSPTTEEFDIFILDLSVTPNTITPVTNTGDSLSSDRPAWSPDGTRIAYENQNVNNDAERDIAVKTVGSGVPALALTLGAPHEGKPAWSPDSETIYYSSGDIATNSNILQEPSDNLGSATLAIPDSGMSEFQPSISPDGSQMCFTRGTGFNATADVMVTNLTAPSPQILSDDAVAGDYNCTWSPDGQLVAYVNGIFGTGALVMEEADDSSPSPIPLEDVNAVFDGNPDWAPDGRPTCEDDAVTTNFNTPVTIPVDCTDQGPAYELTDVGEGISNDGAPANGTVDSGGAGTPTNLTYTPNPGFSGTDSFKYIGFDEFGFGDDTGTVTVTVRPKGADCDADDADVVEAEVRAKKKQKLKGGALKLKVKVDAGENVSAKAKGKVKPKGGKAAKLKAKAKAIGSGETKALKLKIKGSKGKQKKATAKIAAALAAGKKVKAKVKVTVSDEDGLCESTTTKKLKIKVR